MVRTARRLGRLTGRPLSRALAAVGMMVALNACAIPPVVSVAKLAADGVLFASTGKTSTDHGLSMATGKDCSTFRALGDEDVCQEEVVARVEPVPAEVARDRAAVEALVLTAPADPRTRHDLADQALAQAFRPHAVDGAPAAVGTPAVAVLPRPMDGTVKVAVLRPRAEPVRLAAADAVPAKRVVRSRPGLIKATATPPKSSVTKVAARDAIKVTSRDGVQADPPPAPGAMERFGGFLRTAFRFGRTPD